MSTDHRTELAKIKRFDQLIAYLRDQMGWPIAKDSFADVDDLFYDFTADELGIDPKTAAKIESIKRLRPLSPNQPWGIFFIKFEPKKLPVVALRRILSRVALKKRASANSAERAAWAADDLLFVSNFGEGNDRQISFAHFSQDRAKGDLPILKVLGWNDRDTVLHLDGVVAELTTKLSWPDDESNADRWREKWRSAFTLRPDEVIKTSKALAVELAKLARKIRDRLRTSLSIENDKGAFTRLLKAFRQALMHDLSADGFADMYAQTIAYGLLSARVTNPKANTATGLATELPVTNPFLKDLMETFLHIGGRKEQPGYGPSLDFDELGVSDVVELLDKAKMEAVVRDFGDQKPEEDPVTHFYELFLNEFDQETKKRRGVFYTPRPVVSYIVRAVHELLQTEFGLVDGLADAATWGTMAERHKSLKLPDGVKQSDRFVTVLDPATGTGTFLVEAIDVIHRTLVEKWKSEGGEKKILDLWNEYVPKHLLPRLCGYELLMAPYAIAHLKIGLKLLETGYRFGSEERARIYLTNSLEPASDSKKQMDFMEWIPALAHEALAVNTIKQRQQFTVVIGNPPYSNFGQLNRIPFILELLEDYKGGLAEKKLNLDDDFIKFVRYSQDLLQKTGVGVLGFITNNVYADGITHRRMRESLLETFSEIRLLDLHGSSKRREQAPDGSKDENVFDIMVGVAVLLLTKDFRAAQVPHGVFHGDIWGEREAKYRCLNEAGLRTTVWSSLSPTSPYFFFVPRNLEASDEYQMGHAIQDVFPVFSSGIQTKRDNVAIAETREVLLATLHDFARLPGSALKSKYDLPADGRDWTIEWASAHAKKVLKAPDAIAPILYRPFDSRWTVIDSKSKGFVAYPRYEVMSQMVGGNVGLIVTRQLSQETFQHVFATRQVIDGNSISLQTREYNYLFPLHLRNDHSRQGSLGLEGRGEPNLGRRFLNSLAAKLKLPQTEPKGMPTGLTPEDIFYYAYAVLHSPGYRRTYVQFLKSDFPRLPLTEEAELFHTLARLGGELVGLHLLESARLDRPLSTYVGSANPQVERPSHVGDTVWLDKAQSLGFRGVPEVVWNFRIGGYQACEKWLKDRKGHALSKDDITHYQKIVVALAETIRIMKQ